MSEKISFYRIAIQSFAQHAQECLIGVILAEDPLVGRAGARLVRR